MEGLAISLVSFEEEDQLKGINRLLKRDLPVRQVRGFEVDGQARPMRSAARPGRGRTSSTYAGDRRRVRVGGSAR
jgi:hypothetical protein